MKIIIGAESFAPNISGVAVVTELLADHLAAAGHEVSVFAPSFRYATLPDPTYEAFSVLRLKSIPNPFRKGFRVAFFPRSDVLRAVRDIRPDIIHLQDPTSVCGNLLRAAEQLGIPVIVSNHFSLDYVISYFPYLSMFHSSIRARLMRYLVRFYNRCDHVLCPTQTIKRELEKWGITTPIEAVSNGVDLERFYSYSSPATVRVKYHLPPGPLALYVGRIDKDKSLDVLIRAVPLVLSRMDAHFVLVGDGDEVGKLKAMVEDLGLERKVHFLGWINHDSQDLPEVYQIADVFAIPSAIETQSIVTLEALASGLPVVAADGGALPELVKDGDNGYLFPPGSEADLAEKIVRILRDEDLRAHMRKNSLEIVSEHQIEESFARIAAIYEEVCKSSAT